MAGEKAPQFSRLIQKKRAELVSTAPCARVRSCAHGFYTTALLRPAARRAGWLQGQGYTVLRYRRRSSLHVAAVCRVMPQTE